jgi:K+-transporting ATPase KdpF subunit
MKTKIPNILLLFAVLPAHPDATASNSPISYIIGGIIALLIMGYLIYSLLRPDKF